MDKETAVEFERMKARQDESDKVLNQMVEERKEWNSLFKGMMIKTISWLLLMGGSGVLFGWHLPPEVRRQIMEWASK